MSPAIVDARIRLEGRLEHVEAVIAQGQEALFALRSGKAQHLASALAAFEEPALQAAMSRVSSLANEYPELDALLAELGQIGTELRAAMDRVGRTLGLPSGLTPSEVGQRLKAEPIAQAIATTLAPEGTFGVAVSVGLAGWGTAGAALVIWFFDPSRGGLFGLASAGLLALAALIAAPTLYRQARRPKGRRR